MLFRLFVIAGIFIASTLALAQSPQQAFTWPGGKAWALSFSFDDARRSQIETGVPLFDREGIKATFYVMPTSLESNLGMWKDALATGHEIGNHSYHHFQNLGSLPRRTIEYEILKSHELITAACGGKILLMSSNPASVNWTLI